MAPPRSKGSSVAAWRGLGSIVLEVALRNSHCAKTVAVRMTIEPGHVRMVPQGPPILVPPHAWALRGFESWASFVD